MRRALIVFIAVMAVMLVYPATAPSAKSPSKTLETPTINIVSSRDISIGYPGLSGGEDDGDGDIVGLREGTKYDGGPLGVQSITEVKAWWMYYWMFFRL